MSNIDIQRLSHQDRVFTVNANVDKRETGPMRLAVFASGSGTNFQAIVDAIHDGKLEATIELLVCDKPKAKVVERAEKAGIRRFVFNPKEYSSKAEYERNILHLMDEYKIDLIVLAGYMRIVSETLIKPYYGRMINIHPSLLPSFPGINGIGQALAYGVKVTGVTVHYVDGGMDTGPIIAQRAVAVRDDDTIDSLAERIHQVEYATMIEVLQGIAAGRYVLEGRIVKRLG